jgi:hypothetical protein
MTVNVASFEATVQFEMKTFGVFAVVEICTKLQQV